MGNAGQFHQVPLMGKYGHHTGSQTSERVFKVDLIPALGSKSTKSFKLRGVADTYDLFDRPETEDTSLLENAQALERALVSPFSLACLEDPSSTSAPQDHNLLRYVKIAEPAKGKIAESAKGPKKKQPLVIQFTAAWCVGFQ